MSAFAREVQTVICDRKGEQKKIVEMFVQTEGRRRYYTSHRRRVRVNLTAPKQAALNDRLAWEYLEALMEMNFGAGDYYLTLTYKHLPADVEEAKRDYDRFAERARKLYKSFGIKFEAVMVMSQSYRRGELVRLHLHVIMRGGVPRELIEALWRKADKAGRCKPGEEYKRLGAKLGRANCALLEPDGNGLAALCAYLAKQPRDGIARRWYATVGLKKPYIASRNDEKYSIKDIKDIAERNADVPDVAWWEREYPGWTLYDDRTFAYRCTESEFSGISIRVKLRKLTEAELEERRKEKEKRRQPKEQVIGHGNAHGGARARVRVRKE